MSTQVASRHKVFSRRYVLQGVKDSAVETRREQTLQRISELKSSLSSIVSSGVPSRCSSAGPSSRDCRTPIQPLQRSSPMTALPSPRERSYVEGVQQEVERLTAEKHALVLRCLTLEEQLETYGHGERTHLQDGTEQGMVTSPRDASERGEGRREHDITAAASTESAHGQHREDILHTDDGSRETLLFILQTAAECYRPIVDDTTLNEETCNRGTLDVGLLPVRELQAAAERLCDVLPAFASAHHAVEMLSEAGSDLLDRVSTLEEEKYSDSRRLESIVQRLRSANETLKREALEGEEQAVQRQQEAEDMTLHTQRLVAESETLRERLAEAEASLLAQQAAAQAHMQSSAQTYHVALTEAEEKEEAIARVDLASTATPTSLEETFKAHSQLLQLRSTELSEMQSRLERQREASEEAIAARDALLCGLARYSQHLESQTQQGPSTQQASAGSEAETSAMTKRIMSLETEKAELERTVAQFRQQQELPSSSLLYVSTAGDDEDTDHMEEVGSSSFADASGSGADLPSTRADPRKALKRMTLAKASLQRKLNSRTQQLTETERQLEAARVEVEALRASLHRIALEHKYHAMETAEDSRNSVSATRQAEAETEKEQLPLVDFAVLDGSSPSAYPAIADLHSWIVQFPAPAIEKLQLSQEDSMLLSVSGLLYQTGNNMVNAFFPISTSADDDGGNKAWRRLLLQVEYTLEMSGDPFFTADHAASCAQLLCALAKNCGFFESFGRVERLALALAGILQCVGRRSETHMSSSSTKHSSDRWGTVCAILQHAQSPVASTHNQPQQHCLFTSSTEESQVMSLLQFLLSAIHFSSDTGKEGESAQSTLLWRCYIAVAKRKELGSALPESSSDAMRDQLGLLVTLSQWPALFSTSGASLEALTAYLGGSGHSASRLSSPPASSFSRVLLATYIDFSVLPVALLSASLFAPLERCVEALFAVRISLTKEGEDVMQCARRVLMTSLRPNTVALPVQSVADAQRELLSLYEENATCMGHLESVLAAVEQRNA